MRIADYHLTYCTNIHPGESWEATFTNLKDYIPQIKKDIRKPGLWYRASDIG